MWPNPQKNVDFVRFTEKIRNGKHFLYSANLQLSVTDFLSIYGPLRTPDVKGICQ